MGMKEDVALPRDAGYLGKTKDKSSAHDGGEVAKIEGSITTLCPLGRAKPRARRRTVRALVAKLALTSLIDDLGTDEFPYQRPQREHEPLKKQRQMK